jgi:hypothetical protein
VNTRTLWPGAVVAVLITAGAWPAAQNVVEIRIRGRFFPEPATVRLTVAVEPSPENRTLVVEADGDRLYRSSEVALEGEHGKRLHTLEFKNLPAGEYTLRAEVLSNVSVRGIAEEYVTVGDPGDHD